MGKTFKAAPNIPNVDIAEGQRKESLELHDGKGGQQTNG